jgi:hypothetical protein
MSRFTVTRRRAREIGWGLIVGAAGAVQWAPLSVGLLLVGVALIVLAN